MQTLTLPIEDSLTLSAEEARGMGALLADDFNQAAPFPHIVLDDFLPPAVLQRAVQGFPAQALAVSVMAALPPVGMHISRKSGFSREGCSRLKPLLQHS